MFVCMNVRIFALNMYYVRTYIYVFMCLCDVNFYVCMFVLVYVYK